MRIGIDISQTAYRNTGVAIYLENLVLRLVEDEKHEFILFFSSLRGEMPEKISTLASRKNVVIKKKKIPPSILHLLWNVLHKMDIEKFLGPLDIMITSDWTEPPVKKARKATILYDLIVYKYPEETHSRTGFNFSNLRLSSNIVDIQKRKLEWVKKESDIIFCISEATKKDALDILNIPPQKLKVIYPGFD